MGIDSGVFVKYINFFGKSLTRIPATKVISNSSGQEEFTDGTPVVITGVFFRKKSTETQGDEGLLEEADAILQVLPTVTIAKNDKITYNGETFRILVDPVLRKLGTTSIYIMAELYLE